jgi:hypothetical protein
MNIISTFTVVALLGLVSSQAVTDAKIETLVESSTLQSDFMYNSNQLAMPWDNETIETNAASCKVYEDFTLFNLNPIRGPY